MEDEVSPAKKKKKLDPYSDEEDEQMPSSSSGPLRPLLPIQLGADDPPTEEEDLDSDGTLFYPEDDIDDSLLVIDEAEWRGLSDNHRIASNTASFSFVTSMEGVVQNISELSTTPATYSSLFSGLRGEPRVSGHPWGHAR